MDPLPDMRITNLEMTLAHQARAIEDMSAVLTSQWAEIDRLSKKLESLTSRFLALEETAAPAIEATKPPHW